MVLALTGVTPNLRGTLILKNTYLKILRALTKLPKDSAYRINTEAIICHRLSIVNQSETPSEIENTICCGCLEMLLSQAVAEHELCQKMLMWKPWEPLVHKSPPGQWKWPPMLKIFSVLEAQVLTENAYSYNGMRKFSERQKKFFSNTKTDTA